MLRYKAGTKVKIKSYTDIRKTLVNDRIPMPEHPNGSINFATEMRDYCGQVFTINSIRENCLYNLKGERISQWYWADAWVETAFQPTLLDDNLFEV